MQRRTLRLLPSRLLPLAGGAARSARRLRAAPAACAGSFFTWRDVLDTPAQKSPLASRGIVTGLGRAGKRVVAVGQRGHVLFSDDAGEKWQQAEVPVSADLVAVISRTPRRAGPWAMTASS